ncbi:GDSL-type esterase/lipase family protein [candidate division KSB1 bacterium]|nr:GDSL-type esterase/lipase family protein [candidate division KSB1 bacterium]
MNSLKNLYSYFALVIFLLSLPCSLKAQFVIDNFDSYQDTSHYRILSGSTGNTLGVTVSQDTVFEGQGAFKFQWRVQANSFAGIWTRLEFWHPDSTGVWDLSPYLNLRLSYFNAKPSSHPGKVKFQIYFYETSNAPENANSADEVEIWLLDNDILDTSPGWKQIELPLRQTDIGALEQDRWLPSPLGIAGNKRLDIDKIRGFALVFAGSTSLYFSDPKYASGVLFVDDFRMVGEAAGDIQNAVHIVVLGSSTAEGTGPADKRNAWVNRYRSFLKMENANHRVDNLAKGGYTTYHILPTGQTTPANRPKPDDQRNITRALALQPDGVIINLPSNDATAGYSIEEQLANYDSLLAVANRSNTPVWIATTQPRNLSQTGRQNLMAMRDSTLARFDNFAIDFWTELAQENGMINPQYDCGDGIHLNDVAHKILFNRVNDKNIPKELSSSVFLNEFVPRTPILFSNYPNPFNSSTIFEFQLPYAANVELQVFNLLGQKIAILKNDFFPAGINRIFFNAEGLASGIYLYNMKMGKECLCGKMTYLR